MKTVERSGDGTFTKAKHGVKVKLRGAGGEDWDAHVKRGRLLISSGGNLTEYTLIRPGMRN